MSQLQQLSGTWIFLSHSHLDLDKVRYIRNELERMGHNPLIFFLKCLEDNEALLPDLIKREIEAREWFILCKSPNACASKWVKEEVALIKSLEGKTYEIIDINDDLEAQLIKITGFCKRATISIISARSDLIVSQQFRDYFIAKDYSVWISTDPELHAGPNWDLEIEEAIDEALLHGFVLLLLSEAFIRENQFCRLEMIYALKKAITYDNIIPIFINNFNISALPPDIFPPGCYIQYFDFTKGQIAENLYQLERNLRTRKIDFSAEKNEKENNQPRDNIISGNIIESLARQINVYYTRTSSSPHLKPWIDLPEDNKHFLRQKAEDILNMVQTIGLTIRPAQTSQIVPLIFTSEEIEVLAKMEHERWMEEKIRDGWTFGSVSDHERKIHNCLVPWEELREYEKEKDREMVRNIPEILSSINYEIVRII